MSGSTLNSEGNNSLMSRISSALKTNSVSARESPADSKHIPFPSCAAQPLLPFHICRPFLEDHPLICATRIDPKDIWRCILDLHEHISSLSKSSMGEQATVEMHETGMCQECLRGRLVLDSKEGFLLCERCGVVSQERLHCMPDYEEESESVRLPKVAGVPRWMVDMYLSPGNQASELRFFEDMTHWNFYSKLTTDDVHTMAVNMNTWHSGSFSFLCRVVTGLIYMSLSEHFYDESKFRSALKKKQKIETITTYVPEPKFACTKCAFMCHDMKSARFHCKWARKK